MKSNITPGISEKIGKNLHNKTNHPIEIIKRKIYSILPNDFLIFDNLNPVVNIEENFDKLLIPKDHPARAQSDTFYVDDKRVLRTHTSAHQNELLSAGHTKFLVTGDVYRKDEIDATHYPVFHQMEGVCIVDDDKDPKEELVKTLSSLVTNLFPGRNFRLKEDYFPFTEPSFEIEVDLNGKWIEVLGCGVVQPKIMENCGLSGKKAWAFGLGLERLAMIFFKIPDIRYFWSEDERFLKQFESGEIVEFKPYSKYPACILDLSFWISDKYNDNEFYGIVREIGGDSVEEIKLFDEFVHPKTNRKSKAFTITYRSNDKGLTTEEAESIQNKIKSTSIEELGIEIR